MAAALFLPDCRSRHHSHTLMHPVQRPEAGNVTSVDTEGRWEPPQDPGAPEDDPG